MSKEEQLLDIIREAVLSQKYRVVDDEVALEVASAIALRLLKYAMAKTCPHGRIVIRPDPGREHDACDCCGLDLTGNPATICAACVDDPNYPIGG